MKSMFYTLLFGAVAMIAMPAFGDPQVNVEDEYCHFPYDYYNDDNELYAAECDPVVVEQDAKNEADGFGEANWLNVPRGLLASFFPPPGTKVFVLPFKLKLTGKQTGFTCTLTDANNDTYTTQKWWVTLRVSQGAKPNRLDLTTRVLCLNAQQQS